MRKIAMTQDQFSELCRVYNAACDAAETAAAAGRTLEAVEAGAWASFAGLLINLAEIDAQMSTPNR